MRLFRVIVSYLYLFGFFVINCIDLSIISILIFGNVYFFFFYWESIDLMNYYTNWKIKRVFFPVNLEGGRPSGSAVDF